MCVNLGQTQWYLWQKAASLGEPVGSGYQLFPDGTSNNVTFPGIKQDSYRWDIYSTFKDDAL